MGIFEKKKFFFFEFNFKFETKSAENRGKAVGIQKERKNESFDDVAKPEYCNYRGDMGGRGQKGNENKLIFEKI